MGHTPGMTKEAPGPFYRAITATIRAEEAAKNMTRGELAEKSRIPARSLHTYLTDQREMKISQMDDIARALGLRDFVELAELASKRLEES